MRIDDWIADYARRRYGPATPPAAVAAWSNLARSVYNATDAHTDHARDIPDQPPRTVAAGGGACGA